MPAATQSVIAIAALAIAIVAPAAAHDFQAETAAAVAASPGVAEAELARPPASGAQSFVITSTGGTHGQSVRWVAPDGSRWARESLLLRGFKTEVDQRARLAADGSVAELAIRGTTPSGNAAERFAVVDGRLSYASPVDKGEAAASGGFYVPYGGLLEPTILLAEALYKAPGKSLAIFEGGFVFETDETQPMYKPYDGLFPPVIGRTFKGGSFAPTAEVSRERMRASYAKLQELVVALYRAGVPIVAGADGAGPELICDLELYVAGGLAPAEALATATIIPSQVFGVAAERGSIAVGKLSDLVLVDGDPSTRIGDLRRVTMVMLGDRLMNGDDLRAAAGVTGMPK